MPTLLRPLLTRALALSLTLSLAALVLACGTTGSQEKETASPSDKARAGKESPAQWIARCGMKRRELEERPDAARIYSPRPTSAPTAPVWRLSWQGFAVPVPALKYSEVLLSREHKKEAPSVILMGPEKQKVLLSYQPYRPLKESYSEEGLDLIHRVEGFSGGTDFIRTVIQSYFYSPGLLSCSPDSQERDTLIILLLTQKQLAGPGKLQRVFRWPGQKPGLVREYKLQPQKLVLWDANLVRDSEKRPALAVSYFMVEGGPHAAVGLMLGSSGEDTAQDRPAWMVPLQAYLASPTKARKSALRKALSGGGMGKKSLEALDKLK